MFSDFVKIHVRSGKGGNGCVSFRREKYVPKGGPDGGDGGKGGDIIFVANPNLNTLFHLHYKKNYIASNGNHGYGQKCHGRNGEDLEIEVPPGTVVLEGEGKTQKQICDLHLGERFVYLRGGRGGFGNAHFTTSIRQTPKFAELGEPGREKEISLELKLVADLGIIGFPSVGKSTLISRISAAKPKIAEYHFTTLVPNLGVVSAGEETFVACDIPGIIEDAHKGKGLGHKFLRHVERCRVLLHLLDLTREDPIGEFRILNKELKKYSNKLADKFQIVALNKSDAADLKVVEKIKVKLSKFVAKKPEKFHEEVFIVSSVAGKGIDNLMFQCEKLIKKYKPVVEEVKQDIKVFKPEGGGNKFEVIRRRGFFEVKGERIEQLAVMTDKNNQQSMARLADIIKKMDIDKGLRKKKAKAGSKVHIADKIVVFEG